MQFNAMLSFTTISSTMLLLSSHITSRHSTSLLGQLINSRARDEIETEKFFLYVDAWHKQHS